MSAPISTRVATRAVLTHVLRTDADLTAFCLDYFPVVHNEFSAGMGRTDKLNVLLSRIDTEEILARLYDFRGSDPLFKEHFPELAREFRSENPHVAPPSSCVQPACYERTYPIWADPAEQIVKAALHGLGYSYQTAFERYLIITTQPVNGKSLCVKVINLMGNTRISVQIIPPEQDSSVLISKFFQTFDALRQD